MGKSKKSAKKPQKGVGNNTMKNAVNKAIKEDQNKVIRGKVKWFNVMKGYGFIIGDDGKEYFCHHSGIINGKTYTGLENSDTVEFRITSAEKGPQAVDISRVEVENDEKSGSENAEAVSEESKGSADESAEPGDDVGTETSEDSGNDS